ncbi:alpha-D-ribose 1-methylphosphonate 5-triphosphate diphosphatase [Microbacterium marinilacus]|uniref:Alpha-D-ribose 1-methylphosphonate 5-triphosphate diphosphatase n=1 Tax=Microbacterium marinilacus TaxID=415209 RepID=A0ABP7B6J2_9MICO|nr:alpha-D-ribose 1-methylphosphonate 5-triphosphate diphosphatase [Microbacterium marinilacus]MBY0687758.1 alpha-D-ribose 1-methylphosphonate 5-triphosphate diphosphatase [Microbacterium marinilacus]
MSTTAETATETVFTNARVVLHDEVVHGAVRVVDGRIADVSESVVATGVDLEGDFLMPGVVEVHTDQVEAHFQPRPQRFWDPIPAVIAHDAQMAASGTTTVLDALRIGTGPTDGNDMAKNARTLIDAVVHAAESGLLRADHFVHLRCEVSTPDVVDVFDAVGAHERVRMVSLMDHTPGQRQYADVEAFRTYMVGKGRLSHEQFDAHVAELHRLSARYADAHRRQMAERAAARGITMAAHDDATQAHVDEGVALGVGISEFPTTLDAARAARAAGQLVVMGAPNIVRGGSHSGNVAAVDLLAQGLLDILSSDYVPASPLQAAFLLSARGDVTLPEAARLISANPARAVGLDDRGGIEPGRRADLVRVHAYDEAPVEHHPIGSPVPIVRGVWREGVRVA